MLTPADLQQIIDAAGKATPGYWRDVRYLALDRDVATPNLSYIASLPPEVGTALARIARAAIAADAMDPNPRTAQAMALRDLLIEQGLRK